MATAKITLIGMDQWNDHLWDGLVLPNDIDRDTFISSLMVKYGEMEVLYPDPDFMQKYIGVWSIKWQRTFIKWVEGMKANWNPIENYDRYEEFEDKGSKTTKNTSSGSDNSTMTGSGTNENKVSAFDSSGYQPKDYAETSTSSGSNSTTSLNSDGSEATGSTHKGHIHGNIGVTTSAAMLAEFLDIAKWNLYDHMADIFASEMLIPVY